MDINLKSLIGKLNDTARRALEGAAGLCLSRTNYNVEVEHWLLKMLEADDTDLSRVLRYYEIDPGRLERDLTGAVDGFKTGNSRPPALSPTIVELVREAWVLASVEFGAPAVRSGHLLLALLGNANLARLARESAPGLTKIDAEALQKDFRDLVAGSCEDAPVSHPAAAADPGRSRGSAKNGGPESIHDRSDRACPPGRNRSGAGPRRGDPADHRYPHPAPPEQSDPDRRSGRRQDGGRGRFRPAHRRGRRPAVAAERVDPHARPGAAAGRCRRQGRIREPAEVGDRRSQVVAHPRSSCSSTKRTR